MKNQLTKLALAILLATGFTATAKATCLEGCITTPQQFSFGGEANGISMGSYKGVFTGATGSVEGRKHGYAGADFAVEGAGSGCGTNCGNIHWTGSAYGGEHVWSKVISSGSVPGKTVSGLNVNEAGAGAKLKYGKMPVQ